MSCRDAPTTSSYRNTPDRVTFELALDFFNGNYNLLRSHYTRHFHYHNGSLRPNVIDESSHWVGWGWTEARDTPSDPIYTTADRWPFAKMLASSYLLEHGLNSFNDSKELWNRISEYSNAVPYSSDIVSVKVRRQITLNHVNAYTTYPHGFVVDQTVDNSSGDLLHYFGFLALPFRPAIRTNNISQTIHAKGIPLRKAQLKGEFTVIVDDPAQEENDPLYQLDPRSDQIFNRRGNNIDLNVTLMIAGRNLDGELVLFYTETLNADGFTFDWNFVNLGDGFALTTSSRERPIVIVDRERDNTFRKIDIMIRNVTRNSMNTGYDGELYHFRNYKEIDANQLLQNNWEIGNKGKPNSIHASISGVPKVIRGTAIIEDIQVFTGSRANELIQLSYARKKPKTSGGCCPVSSNDPWIEWTYTNLHKELGIPFTGVDNKLEREAIITEDGSFHVFEILRYTPYQSTVIIHAVRYFKYDISTNQWAFFTIDVPDKITSKVHTRLRLGKERYDIHDATINLNSFPVYFSADRKEASGSTRKVLYCLIIDEQCSNLILQCISDDFIDIKTGVNAIWEFTENNLIATSKILNNRQIENVYISNTDIVINFRWIVDPNNITGREWFGDRREFFGTNFNSSGRIAGEKVGGVDASKFSVLENVDQTIFYRYGRNRISIYHIHNDRKWHTNRDYYNFPSGADNGYHFKPVDSNSFTAFASVFLDRRIEMHCPAFGWSYSPTRRAAIMLHEAAHLNYNATSISGPCFGHHTHPITDNCADDWTFHTLTGIPLDEWNWPTQVHYMYQIQCEFLTDLAINPSEDLPFIVHNSVLGEARDVMNEHIMPPPPPWSPGEPRPF